MLETKKKIEMSTLKDIYFKNYRTEDQIGRVFFWFSILSVIIAALGLYGISINALRHRIKEIGIRKAIGASSISILSQLQIYFVKIILLSVLFALPLAWYLCRIWLNTYPYKTTMSWWIFSSSFFLAVLVAVLTIGYKTWIAANSNPVKAIQYE